MFKDLEDIVISNFYATNKSYQTKELTATDLFTSNDFNKLLDKYIKPNVRKQVLEVFKETLNDINEDTTNIQSRFDKQINNNIKSTIDKMKKVEDTVKNDIMAIIDKNANMSAGELADTISEHFTQYSGTNSWKAKRIATTANTQIVNESQQTIFNEYDIQYMWLTMRDGDVRDTHADMDGEVPDKNGYFNVGGYETKYPGGTGAVEEDINCRCILIPS
jgi:transcription-repair coupling factor (superfamily II helicase)